MRGATYNTGRIKLFSDNTGEFMKQRNSILICCLAIFTAAFAAPSDAKKRPATTKNIFAGTWCVGGEALVITFKGKDSITVAGHRDTSLKGIGTFVKNDSQFIATVFNAGIAIKMVYRYEIRSDSAIKAKIIAMEVDGEKADHPIRWLRMKRCDPSMFDFSDTTSGIDEPKPAAKKTGSTR
jgi:hypothetical protein